MPDRTLIVNVAADVSRLKKGLDTAGKDADRFGKKVGRGLGGGLKKLSLAAGGAGLVLGGALAVGLKGSIDAAIEAEKSQANLRNALKNVGADTPKVRAQVDGLVTSLSTMSGFDDEDLQDAFSDLTRTTGSAKTAMSSMSIVADLARAKNISLASAAKIVGRVQNGNTGILKRYGIELGKNATAQDALAAMQKKFGGAAEAYGKTTAGSIDRAKVAVGNLQESIGKQLAPAVAWLATKGAEYVNKFGPVIAEKLGAAVAWVKANWPQIRQTVQRVMAALRPIVVPILNQIKGAIRLVMAVIRGDWSAAWNAIKSIVRNKIAEIKAIVSLAGPLIIAAAKRIGSGLKDRISEGASAALAAVRNKIGELPGVVRGFAGAAASAAVSLGSSILSGVLSGLASLPGRILDLVKSAIRLGAQAFNSAQIPRFTISTPSFTIPGPGPVPDISIGSRSVGFGPFGLPDIPGLATGGTVTRRGATLVGERGPELLDLPRGARVTPLGGGGITVVVNVAGSVVSERDLVESVRKGLQTYQRRNVSVGFA